MGKYIDFDRALEEAAEEPVVVRYQGREWQLYAAMPAKPVLRLLRAQDEGGGQLSEGQIVAMLGEIVPPAVFEAWQDGGMTVPQMEQLLQAIMAAYRFGGDDEGEAQGPDQGPSPSSSAGLQ